MKVSETFWLNVIGMFQVGSIAIGVIVFFLVPKKVRLDYIELGLFLIGTLLIEVTGWTVLLTLHRNTNVINNFFDLINLPLLLLLYRRRLEWPNKNAITYSALTFFLAFAFINLFFIQGLHGPGHYTSFVASFFFIVIAITYLFNDVRAQRLKRPMFWITIASLIYHGVTIYIYIWQEYMVEVMKNNFIGAWMVHNSIGIVHYLLLAYALLLARSEHILRSPTLN
ncbi:MAG TPA: hypothetical protein VFE50_06525 [Cyclobacteriaceae bacterium]|nr:hypothetical protein [Cyclobacteriaceae bacterium]